MISAACPLAGDEHSSLANAELTFGTVTTPGGRARWIAVGQDSVDLHDAPRGIGVDPVPNPGHAPGHRHLGPPPDLPGSHMSGPFSHQHHQAWLGTGGRVDRLRRNERHGDEKKD